MTTPPHTLPNLPLLNEQGIAIKPSESLGKFVVIYFFPKALTSGCTAQACHIRDHHHQLNQLNIKVLGISPDSSKVLFKFKEKEGLNFDLLSDPEHIYGHLFDSWQEKKLYGRTYMGLNRDTFLYSPQGELITYARKISPKDHISWIIDNVSSYKS